MYVLINAIQRFNTQYIDQFSNMSTWLDSTTTVDLLVVAVRTNFIAIGVGRNRQFTMGASSRVSIRSLN